MNRLFTTLSVVAALAFAAPVFAADEVMEGPTAAIDSAVNGDVKGEVKAGKEESAAMAASADAKEAKPAAKHAHKKAAKKGTHHAKKKPAKKAHHG